MGRMIVKYRILRNNGLGKFILKKRTTTMKYQMSLKDYEYQQEIIVSEISSKESVSQHR